MRKVGRDGATICVVYKLGEYKVGFDPELPLFGLMRLVM